MDIPPGLVFALVINAILVGVLVFAYHYRVVFAPMFSQGASADSAEEWVVEAVTIARDLQHKINSDGPPGDRGRIQQEMLPASNRLKRLARTAPPDVSDQFVQQVYELAIECQKLGMEVASLGPSQRAVGFDAQANRVAALAKSMESDASEVHDLGGSSQSPE